MCGRFTMATHAEALEERFRAPLSTEIALPTYNAAPSQAQLTILNDHPQAIVRAAWGFVPEWADGRPDVKPLINARAETVGDQALLSGCLQAQTLPGLSGWVLRVETGGEGQGALPDCLEDGGALCLRRGLEYCA